MDFIAEKDIFLIPVSPLGVTVRVVSGAVALPFAGADFPAEAVGISPQVSGIDGGITTKDYLQCYSLDNKLVETFIEASPRRWRKLVKVPFEWILRKLKLHRRHNHTL